MIGALDHTSLGPTWDCDPVGVELLFLRGPEVGLAPDSPARVWHAFGMLGDWIPEGYPMYAERVGIDRAGAKNGQTPVSLSQGERAWVGRGFTEAA